MNYAPVEATNSREAIEKFKAGVYAAILMDIPMPGMDGFECTKEIRAIEKGSGQQIPIIGFTSCRDSDIVQKCLDAGMDGCLDKDCSPDQLEHALKTHIGNFSVR